MNEPDTIVVPWTREQVEAINRWQRSPWVHELTCGSDSTHRPLKAEPRGLYCPDCEYFQNWVPAVVVRSKLL